MKYIGVLRVNGITLDTTVLAGRPTSRTTETVNVVNINDGLESVEDFGIFYHVSRINHDCLANTYTSWNDKTERYVIHALRDMAKGEEITMEYLKLYLPRRERQAFLRREYGFDCACHVCTLSRQQSREHDKLMVELQRRRDTTLGYFNTLHSLGVPPLCFLSGRAIRKIMMPDLVHCLEEIN